MAIGGKIKIKGGERLKRYIRDVQRNRDRVKGSKAEVGFFGPQIATLAATHELGTRDKDGGPKLPARPAFGQARENVRREVRRVLREQLEGKRGMIEPAALESAALAGLEVVRESYRNAPGPELSERQKARKRGTPGEGKKLIGVKGPKLIGHLEARIDGRKVGE